MSYSAWINISCVHIFMGWLLNALYALRWCYLYVDVTISFGCQIFFLWARDLLFQMRDFGGKLQEMETLWRLSVKPYELHSFWVVLWKSFCVQGVSKINNNNNNNCHTIHNSKKIDTIPKSGKGCVTVSVKRSLWNILPLLKVTYIPGHKILLE